MLATLSGQHSYNDDFVMNLRRKREDHCRGEFDMQKNSSLMRVIGIKKNFGAVQALKGVSFTLNHREVVGLLGDNGAGKSTLIKILTGVFPPDEGKIYFEGKKVNFRSPREARKMGIETVYQGSPLVELLSISRNFFLGREPKKKIGLIPVLDKKKMREESERVVREIGIKVRSSDENVRVLSGGERQAISIGRTMYFGVKLLILDEPLNNLSVKEQRMVLKRVEEVKEAGISAIFISHNIHHVYSIADRFIILNKGVKVAEVNREEATVENIEKMIIAGKIDIDINSGNLDNKLNQ